MDEDFLSAVAPLALSIGSAYPAPGLDLARDAEDDMRRVALALGALVLLIGSYTSAIKLRHPDGRSATCGDSYAVGYHHVVAADRDRDCVRDYQRQGYERVPN